MAETKPRQTVGRTGELQRLTKALEEARKGSGQVVVVQGMAGAGKTHLLRCADTMAREAGFNVLRAAGGTLTSDVSFGIALELLDPLLQPVAERPRPELAPLLKPDSEMRPEDSAPEAADVSSIALARLCIEAAGDRPLLLIVDDVQWADAPSLGVLEAIARRMAPAPILLLVGQRLGEIRPETSSALALLTGELLGERIEVGPLESDEVGALLGLRGVAVEGTEAVERCAQLTGGNALLVTRMAAVLKDRQESVTVSSLGRIADEDAVDLAASVTSQLERLGKEATEVAAVAAVLEEHARWRHIVALSDLEERGVEEAWDALVAAGLLEPSEPVAFTHPLVREAVYRSQTPSQISRRHRAAAQRLIEEEADPEQVASHLLLTPGEGSPIVVGQLMSAARQAMRRGVPSTAVGYLERALSEPPAGDDRSRVLILLGWVVGQLGSDDAEQHFTAARQATEDPELLAEADLGLGRHLYARGAYAEAESVLERGRQELGPHFPEDEGLAAELRATALAAARYAGTLNARTDERLSQLLDDDAPGSSKAERALLAELAAELGVRAAHRDQVISLALRSWADGEMLLTADRHGIAISQVAAALVWSDAYDEADEMLTVAARHCAATGARTGQATARYMRAWVRLYRGDFDGAVADGRAALRADGWAMYVPPAAAIVAHCMIELADIAAAEEVLELPGGDERWSSSMPFALALEARGRLAMERRDFKAALGFLDACAEHCLPLGEHHPFSSWRARKALCLNELGDRSAALALIEEELRPCRRAGAPRPLGIALTAAGVIDGERGVELIGEACSILAGSGAVVDHARALMELGQLLRRRGRDEDARRPLREALALADGIGAVAVTEQAAAELTAAGGRPRRRALLGPDSLTPAERRAARLAAAGCTNREIAEKLVVTPKTVQFHLSNAYRKLGVASREELKGAL